MFTYKCRLPKKHPSTGKGRKRVCDDITKDDEDFERLCSHSTPKKKKDQDSKSDDSHLNTLFLSGFIYLELAT